MLANGLLALAWTGISIYVLLAGADFGGGLWDLLAGGSRRGERQRALIEHSVGPVWEANHVWLIFVLVLVWTAFPPLFASVSSTLYIPLTLVALGVIARGSAFAFRKAVTELWQRRLFGAAFAFSSVVTPFFLGAAGGAIASGRVPPGIAAGNILTSWWNPTSVMAGVFTVGACAYLAAVYLTADARRGEQANLAEQFRRRGLVTGIILGGLAIAGLLVVHLDAPLLYARLTGPVALPLVVLSLVAGVLSLGLLFIRRFVLVRITAALAVAAVLWGWGLAQYPDVLLPGLTISQAASPPATLLATTICVAAGLVLLLPSLAWLFLQFQRSTGPEEAPQSGAQDSK
jgi:cytochrome bd ubiquinol oxidase subunit II